MIIASCSRALMHLSRYLRANPQKLQDNLTFLQDIYVGLNDPDGVAGAAALRKKEASLNEKIIEHKAQGRLQDALTCYERLIGSSGPGHSTDSEQHQRGVVECLLALHQPLSALTTANGMIAVTSGALSAPLTPRNRQLSDRGQPGLTSPMLGSQFAKPIECTKSDSQQVRNEVQSFQTI